MKNKKLAARKGHCSYIKHRAIVPRVAELDDDQEVAFLNFLDSAIDLSAALLFEAQTGAEQTPPGILIRLTLDEETADAETVRLLDTFLRDDLVTQTAAARSVGVTVHVISQALKDGRLRPYPNPAARNPRHGGRMVSMQEVRDLWGSDE